MVRVSYAQFLDLEFSSQASLPAPTLAVLSKLARELGVAAIERSGPLPAAAASAERDGGGGRGGGATSKRRLLPLPPPISAGKQDWESLRSFQTTKRVARKGLDSVVDKVRASINKLTAETYGESLSQLRELMGELELGEEDTGKLSEVFFDIACGNKFYSALYAKLYAQLLASHEMTLGRAFEDHIRSYIQTHFSFEEGVKPAAGGGEDYDAYCEQVKKSDKRKSLATFFTHLLTQKLLPRSVLERLCVDLMGKLVQKIKQEGNKGEVEDIVELLFILSPPVAATLRALDAPTEEGEGGGEGGGVSRSFFDTLRALSLATPRAFASLTLKAIFQCADLVEKF